MLTVTPSVEKVARSTWVCLSLGVDILKMETYRTLWLPTSWPALNSSQAPTVGMSPRQKNSQAGARGLLLRLLFLGKRHSLSRSIYSHFRTEITTPHCSQVKMLLIMVQTHHSLTPMAQHVGILTRNLCGTLHLLVMQGMRLRMTQDRLVDVVTQHI